MWYKNIAGRFFWLVAKHACDRQTNGQNYDSQDRGSIAASCGKNNPTYPNNPNLNLINPTNLLTLNIIQHIKVQLEIVITSWARQGQHLEYANIFIVTFQWSFVLAVAWSFTRRFNENSSL